MDIGKTGSEQHAPVSHALPVEDRAGRHSGRSVTNDAWQACLPDHDGNSPLAISVGSRTIASLLNKKPECEALCEPDEFGQTPFVRLVNHYNHACQSGCDDPDVVAQREQAKKRLTMALEHPSIAEKLCVIDGFLECRVPNDPQMNATLSALRRQYGPPFKPLALSRDAARQQPTPLPEVHSLAALDLASQPSAPSVKHCGGRQAEALSLASASTLSDQAEIRVRRLIRGLGSVGVYGCFTTYPEETEDNFWSLGDENASVQLVRQLVTLGSPKIICRLSPPLDALVSFELRQASLKDPDMLHIEQEQHKVVLSKLAFLMPEFDARKGLPQTLQLGNSEVTFIRYDDPTPSPPLELGFAEAFVHYLDTGQLPDNYMNVKPYRFASDLQSLVTDIDADGRVNEWPLNLPVNSLLPEQDGQAVPAGLSEQETVTAFKKAGVTSTQLAQNLASVSQLIQVKALSSSTVYGMHHPAVPELLVLPGWIRVVNARAASSPSGTPAVIFINETSLSDDLRGHLNNMGTPVIEAASSGAKAQVNRLKEQGGVAVYVLPSLPKRVFEHVLDLSALPVFAEGANTTSHLLEKGMPYLSLLPDGMTSVPQEMGYPLEALKAEAFSYKLRMTPDHRKGLERLHGLIQDELFPEAAAFIRNNRARLKTMAFLYKPAEELDITTGVTILNVPWLLSKGERSQLGDLEKEALLAACDPSDDGFLRYINSMMDETTPTHDHFALQRVHVGQSFNNTLISALNRFAGIKRITL